MHRSRFRLTSLATLAISLMIALGISQSFGRDPQPTGSITGKVVDADGIGVEDVQIIVYTDTADHPLSSVTSKADGTFVLPSVPVGDALTVKAFHKGHMFDTGATKSQVKVAAGQATDTGSLEMKVIEGSLRIHPGPATTTSPAS